MPDQSSAASEHALMQEITAPLATLPDDAMPLVADVDFPVVLRGYDRLAVDAYVKKARQLVAELQATRSPDAAVRRALERVGEQISGILQRAHDTARQITTQSRREAEDRLEVARGEALEITTAAERRVKELDGDTDRIWAERHRIVDDARDLARQLLALAESAAERFPAAEDTGDQPILAARAVEEHPVETEPEPAGPVGAPDPVAVDPVAADPVVADPVVAEPPPLGGPGPYDRDPEPHDPGADDLEADDPEAETYDPEATAVLPKLSDLHEPPAGPERA